MTAIHDLRAMTDRITRFVAERGDRWERPGTPERLLIDAAALMKGVADGLDRVGVDLATDQQMDELAARRPCGCCGAPPGGARRGRYFGTHGNACPECGADPFVLDDDGGSGGGGSER